MFTTIADHIEKLTDGQRRMLGLAAGGATVSEIAHRLALPIQTVERDQDRLLATLGVRTPTEARVLWWGSRAGAPATLAQAAQELVGNDTT